MANTNLISADDRGEVRHFRGRKSILASFSFVLYRAIDENLEGNGTTFLVQGSPGAGKT